MARWQAVEGQGGLGVREGPLPELEVEADLRAVAEDAGPQLPDALTCTFRIFVSAPPEIFAILVSAHLYFTRCASERERSERERCASSRVPLAVPLEAVCKAAQSGTIRAALCRFTGFRIFPQPPAP